MKRKKIINYNNFENFSKATFVATLLINVPIPSDITTPNASAFELVIKKKSRYKSCGDRY